MMDLVHALFPHLAGVRVDRVVLQNAGVRVEATSTQAAGLCPVCGQESRRVHSRYRRRLADAGVAGREVAIELTVRRFFCDEPSCRRRVFAEQISQVTTRHGRRTAVAAKTVLDVGSALGGRAGARLIAKIGAPVNRMTLLRAVRGIPDPAVPVPRVLGVDDFALRRGHHYATILIDMDSHQPVDVLPDRSADTLATWLNSHPGVQIICRDRAGSYAEGAARGAPSAVQVADRWHLLKNLSDAVEHAAARHRRCLQPQPPTPPQPRTTTEPTPPTQQPGLLAARIQTLHPQVHDLNARGWGIHQIARHLNIDPKTARRYLNATDIAQLLGPASTARGSVVDPFKTYLQQRCDEGVTGTGQLLAEITAMGYRGGERTLRRYLISVRGTEQAAPPQPKVPSARQLAASIMRPDANLTTDERDALTDACTRCPDLAAIRDLARDFTHLLRHRQGTELHSWLARADQADAHELHRFAAGLRKDLAAVIAGLTLPWSSGAVEGNVNRVKMIKRQMYGRANFDLLRKRILTRN